MSMTGYLRRIKEKINKKIIVFIIKTIKEDIQNNGSLRRVLCVAQSDNIMDIENE